MTTAKYIKAIEALIDNYQRIQEKNPPSSPQWQAASAEIQRLAALIVAEKKCSTSPPPPHRR